MIFTDSDQIPEGKKKKGRYMGGGTRYIYIYMLTPPPPPPAIQIYKCDLLKWRRGGGIKRWSSFGLFDFSILVIIIFSIIAIFETCHNSIWNFNKVFNSWFLRRKHTLAGSKGGFSIYIYGLGFSESSHIITEE